MVDSVDRPKPVMTHELAQRMVSMLPGLCPQGTEYRVLIDGIDSYLFRSVRSDPPALSWYCRELSLAVADRPITPYISMDGFVWRTDEKKLYANGIAAGQSPGGGEWLLVDPDPKPWLRNMTPMVLPAGKTKVIQACGHAVIPPECKAAPLWNPIYRCWEVKLDREDTIFMSPDVFAHVDHPDGSVFVRPGDPRAWRKIDGLLRPIAFGLTEQEFFVSGNNGNPRFVAAFPGASAEWCPTGSKTGSWKVRATLSGLLLAADHLDAFDGIGSITAIYEAGNRTPYVLDGSHWKPLVMPDPLKDEHPADGKRTIVTLAKGTTLVLSQTDSVESVLAPSGAKLSWSWDEERELLSITVLEDGTKLRMLYEGGDDSSHRGTAGELLLSAKGREVCRYNGSSWEVETSYPDLRDTQPDAPARPGAISGPTANRPRPQDVLLGSLFYDTDRLVTWMAVADAESGLAEWKVFRNDAAPPSNPRPIVGPGDPMNEPEAEQPKGWWEGKSLMNTKIEDLTSCETTTQKIVSAAKADATDAGWRIAGKQLVRLARDPLAALLARNVAPDDESLRLRVAAFLSTEAGEALLAMGLSLALMAAPNVAAEVSDRLSRELRVRALSDGGDMLAEVLMAPLRQVLQSGILGDAVKAVVPASLGDGRDRISAVDEVRVNTEGRVESSRR